MTKCSRFPSNLATSGQSHVSGWADDELKAAGKEGLAILIRMSSAVNLFQGPTKFFIHNKMRRLMVLRALPSDSYTAIRASESDERHASLQWKPAEASKI
jgi:hypothetical protein